MELLNKAWCIDFDEIEEGYMYEAGEYIVHAKTKNKAKSLLLNLIKYTDMDLRYIDEDINYLNIPIVRIDYYDQYLFEGEAKNKKQIENIIKERERINVLDTILNNPSITYCYIKKGGMYYRPNSCGYTNFNHDAGVYDKAYAVNCAMSCNELHIIPIDIDEHNKMINEKISDLSTRLINN